MAETCSLDVADRGRHHAGGGRRDPEPHARAHPAGRGARAVARSRITRAASWDFLRNETPRSLVAGVGAGGILRRRMELRALTFIDVLQPQLAGFLQTVAQGFLPLDGQASLVVEIAPGIAINALTDVALKRARVAPGHADRRARVRPARAARVRSGRGARGGGGDSGRAEAGRDRPAGAADAVARNHHWRRRPPVGHDQPDATRRHAARRRRRCTRSRSRPPGYAALAANEAEKRADIRLLEMVTFGAVGRVWLGGQRGGDSPGRGRRSTTRWRRWRAARRRASDDRRRGRAPASPLDGIDAALAERLLRRRCRPGGDYADLYFEYRSGADYVLEDGRIRTVGRGVTLGLGVRVLRGDATGYAYTEELAEERMARGGAHGGADRGQRRGAGADRGAAGAARRSLPRRRAVAGAAGRRQARAAPAGRRGGARLRPAHRPRRGVAGRGMARGAGGDVRRPPGARSAADDPLRRVARSPRRGRSGRAAARAARGASAWSTSRGPGRAPRSTGARRRGWRSAMLDAVEAPAGPMEVVLGAGDSGILLHEAVGPRPRGRLQPQGDVELHRPDRQAGRVAAVHGGRRRHHRQRARLDQRRRRGQRRASATC